MGFSAIRHIDPLFFVQDTGRTDLMRTSVWLSVWKCWIFKDSWHLKLFTSPALVVCEQSSVKWEELCKETNCVKQIFCFPSLLYCNNVLTTLIYIINDKLFSICGLMWVGCLSLCYTFRFAVKARFRQVGVKGLIWTCKVHETQNKKKKRHPAICLFS